jgi:hypothetical protein
MKPLSHQLFLYKSNGLKNLSIVLGIFLSFIVISSFHSEELSSESNSRELAVQIDDSSTKDLNAEEQAALAETNSTKYHNFLTSYFLQESSRARKSKRTEEKGQIISNLRDFRNIIVSQGLSLF